MTNGKVNHLSALFRELVIKREISFERIANLVYIALNRIPMWKRDSYQIYVAKTLIKQSNRHNKKNAATYPELTICRIVVYKRQWTRLR